MGARGALPARIVAAVGLIAAVSACATRGDVDYLSEEHRQLMQRQEELEARVSSLEQTMTQLQQLLTQIRADFKADLGAVRDGLNSMESALRGTETRIEQLRQVPPPAPQEAPEDSTAASPGDQVALYNGAITDYQQGRLELARQGFQEYLRLYPRGLSAPDAQYWLGIISYDQKQYRDAIQTLQVVAQRYPDSGKAPLALRKIGDAYRALGENDRARAAYRELIQRYPNSSEADAARRELGS